MANTQIKKVVEEIIKSGNNNFLVIADNVEGEALATLVLNHQNRIINVCCVKPQYALETKKEWLTDMAILTGGRVVSEETGVLLENIDMSFLGKAEKVIVTKDKTTIVNGRGDKEAIDNRANALKSELANSQSEADKQVLRERIGALTGGIGVIRVGAITDTELKAKKYKIEDAVNATKAALEEGIVIGGGACLAKIADEISDPIFKKALVKPLEQMALNAGIYDKVTLTDKLLSRPYKSSKLVKDVKRMRHIYDRDIGFNFKTKKFEDMMKTGVTDPAKVTRLAVESAVSVVKSLVRGETVITEIVEE